VSEVRPFRFGRLTLTDKQAIWGYLFMSPFIVGFALFILYPLIQTVIFSLSNVKVTPSGMVLEYVGLENFKHIFLVDANFVRSLTDRVRNTIVLVPLILLFSFFVANVLNQEFRGRGLCRTIFFLPVILSAEAVMRLESRDFIGRSIDQRTLDPETVISTAGAVRQFLLRLSLPEGFLQYFVAAVDYLPEVIRASAIPILIFLAGLQSIPPSLFEAATVEGASGWESFWKITFPMISPLILTNTVFIVIDSFVVRVDWAQSRYGIFAAQGLAYLAVVAVILAIAYAIVSRNVFYHE